MSSELTIINKAFKKLELYGIHGRFINLLDIIPLIEIAWADGQIQNLEFIIINTFLKDHVKRINEKAGSEVLTYKEASDFLCKFLNKRPNPIILKILREMYIETRFLGISPKKRKDIKISIINLCLDIGAAAVTQYPYPIDDRFNSVEKNIFLDILNSLGVEKDREI